MAQIMVVEDDRSFAEALASALRSEGHEVLVALCADEGVELGLTHYPDVVIADWVLGDDMHGGKVCELIQAARPSVKTILTTGYLDDVFEIRGWSKYAETLLEKPFHKEAIIEAVNRAILERISEVEASSSA